MTETDPARAPATTCSFCERGAEAIEALIQGPNGLAICDRCARLAVEVADDQKRENAAGN